MEYVHRGLWGNRMLEFFLSRRMHYGQLDAIARQNDIFPLDNIRTEL